MEIILFQLRVRCLKDAAAKMYLAAIKMAIKKIVGFVAKNIFFLIQHRT
jgi:hypothetical protein